METGGGVAGQEALCPPELASVLPLVVLDVHGGVETRRNKVGGEGLAQGLVVGVFGRAMLLTGDELRVRRVALLCRTL